MNQVNNVSVEESVLRSLDDLRIKTQQHIRRFAELHQKSWLREGYGTVQRQDNVMFLQELMQRGKIDFSEIPRTIRFDRGIYCTAFRICRGRPTKTIEYLKIMIDDVLWYSVNPAQYSYRLALDDMLESFHMFSNFAFCWEDEVFEKFMSDEFAFFVQRLHIRIREHGWRDCCASS